MGSSGSKAVAAADGGAGDGGGTRGNGGGDGERSRRWRGERVLGLACLCLPAASDASVYQQEKKRGRQRNNVCTDEPGAKSAQQKPKGCRKFISPCPGRATCSSSSGAEPDADCHESISCTEPGDHDSVSAQEAAITRSSNTLNRSRSRFDFIPDRIVTRLGRAASVGSSAARSSFSTQNPECDDRGRRDCDGWATGRNVIHGQNTVDTMSSRDISRSNIDTEAGVTGHFYQNNVRAENFDRRPSRRHGLQDPLEGSIRFSRTLSVGRLRDRVLRRPSFSEGLFDPLSLENRMTEYHGDGTDRSALRQAIRSASSGSNTNVLASSSGSLTRYMDSSFNTRGYESETPRIREASIHSTLEHRSAFLERRRRIRSQVRELQWLGSRVGHNRSCIVSGQHRTGHCTCRMSRRATNPADDTSTRSSISRIVMLAEALFEVLDEIHQQAVVLASRPSMSSTGSVPAPKEVVERMPLRIYEKAQVYHNEEASQCYICLVEYEDGDCVRILPCRHEFHRICVDKWLKEIHRVCPLCRGDVCISDVPPCRET
ncbi:hypothetical protein Taro_020207 [Colocasia esculenta]|uniref:RING-type domain-containing protein n=1 Tax=Colocasia esculenta TaxID=4460 RepID=A0A843V4I2_COLES|nr:hypothetical protein [Colocasia esculenta]